MAVDFKKIDGDSLGYFALIVFLLIIVGLGYYAYMLEHTVGGLTGESQRVPWGIVNAGIPYFIGLSAGSLIVSALAGVFNIKKYKIFSRMAAFLAIGWIIAALLNIAMDIGKYSHFMNAVRCFNPTSIFSWNAFLYSSYFVVCAIYLLVQFEEMDRATRFMAGVAVFWAVLVHSGTGAIYGYIYSRELYHSALLAPMFIICAITSGLGLLLATMYVTFRLTKRELDVKLVRGLSMVFLGLILILAYFLVDEALEKGYIPGLHKAVWYIFLNPSTGIFWSFWLLMIVGIAIPALIIVIPKTGYDLRWISVAGLLHAIMIFAERFYLIIPGQVWPREYLPGYKMVSLNTLEGYIVTYKPTLIGWMQLFALVALVYLIYVIGLKVFAILPEKAVEEEVVEE